MAKVSDHWSFMDKLASLPLSQQRQVGARFIANVLDLSGDPRLRQVIEIAGKPDPTAEELHAAYRMAHSVYVDTQPHSDLSELNFQTQAAHFVAEACVTCTAPVYTEAKAHHLAQKVATYCLMARTCASIMHDADQPDLGETEKALQKEIAAQYTLVNEFLGSL